MEVDKKLRHQKTITSMGDNCTYLIKVISVLIHTKLVRSIKFPHLSMDRSHAWLAHNIFLSL
jgi:hypothetical protein